MRPPPLRPITGLALPRRLSSFAIALVIAAVAATASPHAGDHVRQVLIRPTVDAETVAANVGTCSGPRGGVFRGGLEDGPAERARYRQPVGVAVAAYDGVTSCVINDENDCEAGIAYVADVANHVIRKVYWSGHAETLAGSGEPGLKDGTGAGAEFYNPSAVAVGPLGELYVADSSNHAIRRVTTIASSGYGGEGVVVTLFAGRSYVTAEVRIGSGPMGLWNPQGIAVWAGQGVVPLRVVVADTDNHRLLWLTPPGHNPSFGPTPPPPPPDLSPPDPPSPPDAPPPPPGLGGGTTTGGDTGTTTGDDTTGTGGDNSTDTSGGGGSRRLSEGAGGDSGLSNATNATGVNGTEVETSINGTTPAPPPPLPPPIFIRNDENNPIPPPPPVLAPPNPPDLGVLFDVTAPWTLHVFAGSSGQPGFADGLADGSYVQMSGGRIGFDGATFRYPRGIALCTVKTEVLTSSLGRRVEEEEDQEEEAAANVDERPLSWWRQLSETPADTGAADAASNATGGNATCTGAVINGTCYNPPAPPALSPPDPPPPPPPPSAQPAPPPPLMTLIEEKRMLVADTGNHAIRTVYFDERQNNVFVHKLAGSGAPGDADSMTRLEKPRASVLLTSILEAEFALPTGVACQGTTGGAIVADTGNHRIRQVRRDGVTVTIAGGSSRGMADGQGVHARFDGPSGISWDPDLNGDRFVVVERYNMAVRNVYLNIEAMRLDSAASGGRTAAVTSGVAAMGAALALCVGARLSRR